MILRSKHFLKSVEYDGTMGEKESRTGRQLIEEEQILIDSNFAMITFRRFFEEFFMLGQLLFIWKSNPVYPLQRIVVLVTAEIA